MPELPSSSDGDDSSLGEPPGLVPSSGSDRCPPLEPASGHSDWYDSSDDESGKWKLSFEIPAEVQELIDQDKSRRRSQRILREARAWKERKRKRKWLPKDGDGMSFDVETEESPKWRRTEENLKWRSAPEPAAWRKAIRCDSSYGDDSTFRKLIWRTCMKCGHWNRDRPDELCAKVHRTDCDFTDDGAGAIRSIMRMIMADQEELQNLSIIRPGDQILSLIHI